jgi:proline iminopeptidase
MALVASLALSGCGKKKEMAVEEGMKNINGVDLYYTVMGTGTPLLILHGGPGFDHTYLLHQMSALAEHCRLVFYDQRASGASRGQAQPSRALVGRNACDDVHDKAPGPRRQVDPC